MGAWAGPGPITSMTVWSANTGLPRSGTLLVLEGDPATITHTVIDATTGTVTAVEMSPDEAERYVVSELPEPESTPESEPSVEDRLAAVEAEIAALRQALIDKSVLDERALNAARTAVTDSRAIRSS